MRAVQIQQRAVQIWPLPVSSAQGANGLMLLHWGRRRGLVAHQRLHGAEHVHHHVVGGSGGRIGRGRGLLLVHGPVPSVPRRVSRGGAVHWGGVVHGLLLLLQQRLLLHLRGGPWQLRGRVGGGVGQQLAQRLARDEPGPDRTCRRRLALLLVV